jgi:hypothetical protein
MLLETFLRARAKLVNGMEGIIFCFESYVLAESIKSTINATPRCSKLILAVRLMLNASVHYVGPVLALKIRGDRRTSFDSECIE